MSVIIDYEDQIRKHWSPWVDFFKNIEIINSWPTGVYSGTLFPCPGRINNFLKVEQKLAQIKRWGWFIEKGYKKRMRVHNTWQHTCSNAIMGQAMAEAVANSNQADKFNMDLARDAAYVHDFDEAFLNQEFDNPHNGKNGDNYLWEYQQVYDFLYSLDDQGLAEHYEQAYLSHFAYKFEKKPDSFRYFPKRAQDIIALIVDKYPINGYLFEIIEHFGYEVYCIEQFLEFDNPYFVEMVCSNKNQHTVLIEELADKVPSWRELVWSDQMSKLMFDILEEL